MNEPVFKSLGALCNRHFLGGTKTSCGHEPICSHHATGGRVQIELEKLSGLNQPPRSEMIRDFLQKTLSITFANAELSSGRVLLDLEIYLL